MNTPYNNRRASGIYDSYPSAERMSGQHRVLEALVFCEFLYQAGVIFHAPYAGRLGRGSESGEVNIIYLVFFCGCGGNRPYGSVVASPSVHQNERAAAPRYLCMEPHIAYKVILFFNHDAKLGILCGSAKKLLLINVCAMGWPRLLKVCFRWLMFVTWGCHVL